MRRALMAALLCLAGCGQGSKAERALETEKSEIEACRATYPPGRSGLFGALVRCEMGAAANYVQAIAPADKRQQDRLSSDFEAKADQVDNGRMSMQDWQSQAAGAVHSLKDAKGAARATSAIL